jgi:glycosyltransferase involved in cell wall biosynthesis
MVISLYEGHIEGVSNVILHKTSKAFYITQHFSIRRAIKEFEPDILHAHHASSYGFLGALQNFHPFIISVWGYDVMVFPQKSPIHKMLIKYALTKADYLTATSKALADASKQLSGKTPQVIPFGVAPEFLEVTRDYNRQELTIGIIKDLRPVYGIADLIKATALLIRKKYRIKLVIIGEGYLKAELIGLSESLGIREYTIISLLFKLSGFSIPFLFGIL